MRLIVAAALPGKTLWYLSRGSGAVSLLLLTASVVLGVVTTVGASTDGLPRFVLQALHRNISLLVTVFLAIHVATVVADSFVPIHLIDAVVPWTSSYRPLWTGLGALAFDLLLALIVTSLLRVRIGLTAWRSVHWFAYACWPIALVHGLGTGSDSPAAWMILLDVVCLAAVVGSVWWRLAARRTGPPPVLLGAAVASVVLPALIGLWAVRGPVHASWACGSGGGSSNGSAAAASALDTLQPGTQDTFQGTYTQADGPGSGQVTLRIDAPLDADPSLTLTVDIVGRRRSSGITVQTATVTVTDGVAQITGPLRTVVGGRIDATVTGPDGRRMDAQVDLRLDSAAGTAGGTLTLAEATA